ncbi:MAG TPA: hypothetical protein VLI39_10810 [Sedimentisphaerales bacterium]|nr:hypothetical protein [Sedimentisphaerales bacterium]
MPSMMLAAYLTAALWGAQAPTIEKKLTDLQWVKATAGWGQAAVGKNASGRV